jgi:hypothetical protein
MAAPLVGTAAVVSTGSSGAAVTPAWGSGQTRATGNLLICWFGVYGSATVPTTPNNWYAPCYSPGTHCVSGMFVAQGTGGNAAPTIAAVSGAVIVAQLGEFVSNIIPNSFEPVPDKNGGTIGTSSPMVIANTAADSNPLGQDVFFYACAAYYSTAKTSTLASTLNNGMTAVSTNSSGSDITSHYDFGYGVPTSKAVASQNSWSFTTTVTSASGSTMSYQTLFQTEKVVMVD